MPPKPSAAASRSVSTGKTSSSSHWRANGNISSRAKARAVSLIARCSSVSSKSTRRPIAAAHWTVNRPACAGGKLVNALVLMVEDVSHRGRNRLRRLIDVLNDALHGIARNGVDFQFHLLGFGEKARVLHRVHEGLAQGCRALRGNAGGR